MRLEISVDSIRHEIDSTDPEILSKWIMEIFARVVANGWNDATWITVRAFPSFIPDPGAPEKMRFDWIADTRYMETIMLPRSPRELIKALDEQLDRYYERSGHTDADYVRRDTR